MRTVRDPQAETGGGETPSEMSVVAVSLVRAVLAVRALVRGTDLVVRGVEAGLALLAPHSVPAGQAGAELLGLVLPGLAVLPAVTELRD